MPRAYHIERKEPSEVDPEERLQVGAVVFSRASKEGLNHEECRHDEKEPGTGFLCGGKRYLVRSTEGHCLLLAPVPPQEIPPAKHPKEQTGSREQCGERKYAPYDGVCSCVIAD